MTTELPLEIFVFSLISMSVGTLMGLIPIVALATGHMKYSRSSSKFSIGKSGPELTIGPVLGTILAGAALVVLPNVGYYLSFNEVEINEANTRLEAQVVELTAQNAEFQTALAGKVDRPQSFTFTGRVQVRVNEQVLDAAELASVGLSVDRVAVQPRHPPARANPDGRFTIKLYQEPNGEFSQIAAIYPTVGTRFIGGFTTITPEKLEVFSDGSSRIAYKDSPTRENVILIDLIEKTD